MRKLKVLASGMYIQGFAEILHRHCRAFYMPAWTAAAERSVPARFLVLADEFPQGKIASVLLLVLVSVDALAAASDIARKIDLRQLSILGKRSDPVIDRAVGFVRLSVLDQLRDDIDHLRNMMRRPRRYFWPLVAKCVKIFPKILYIRRRKFIDAHALLRRLINDPVVDVCQIKNVRDFVTLELQITTQDVAKNERPEIADVRKIPNGRPADIHPHFAFFLRVKFFLLTRQCIKESEHILKLSAINYQLSAIWENSAGSDTSPSTKLARASSEKRHSRL